MIDEASSSFMVDNQEYIPIPPPVKTMCQSLPFGELDWKKFEKLCRALVQKEFSIDSCEIRGVEGQNQQGIDIYARHEDGKYSVYQCKKYEAFQESDLDEIIRRFKEGDFYIKSRRFFICTSCELNRTQLQDSFENHKTLLSEQGIELVKWDKIQLSRKLKDEHKIVYDFFGAEWVKQFNGEEAYRSLTKDKYTTEQIFKQLKTASADLFAIKNHFTKFPDSHIEREETGKLFNWVTTPLKEDESNITVLAGNAGAGKTVILRDLLHLLMREKIPVLGLKADKEQQKSSQVSQSVLGLNDDIQILFDKLLEEHQTVVVLVDQIDALSQALSTDRKQINVFTSLISQLSIINGVRIVISCRIFDLYYDAELRQYADRNVVKVGLLSDSEVEAVLKRLTGEKSASFPKDLVTLLKTPIHLELFCRIYSSRTPIGEIKGIQDLYRHLWQQKISDVKIKADLDAPTLESVLYSIASKIYERQDSLSIPAQHFDKYHNELKYLKTENLVAEDVGNLQFFHQSFFDYTYARRFVIQHGGDISSFIRSQHQGLFIRSIVKQALSYLRSYDFEHYAKQLRLILLSDDIRYHIKHLVVCSLAFEEKPSKEEQAILKSLIQSNGKLAASFFSAQLSLGWAHYLFREKELLVDIVNSKEEVLAEAVRRFLVFSVNNNIDAALAILSSISDSEKRGSYIRWALFHVNDFSKPIVTEHYFSIRDEPNTYRWDKKQILEKAAKSNAEFAIKEVKDVFAEELNSWKTRDTFYFAIEDKDLLNFCEFFSNENPSEAYPFIKELVLSLISATEYNDFYYKYCPLKVLKHNAAFSKHEPKYEEHYKFIDFMVVFLEKQSSLDIGFVKKELQSFVFSSYTTLTFIALRVLNENPNLFKDEVFSILTNSELTEDCLEIEDLRYWYRSLINKSYSLFSENQHTILNDMILSYSIEKDIIPNRNYQNERNEYCIYTIRKNDYRYSIYPYPNWRYNQWLLLASIPEEILQQNIALKKRFLELNRRYIGWKSKSVKPTHGIGRTSRSFLSSEQYKKLSISSWYQTFVKCKENRFSVDNYFDPGSHANEFKEVVKGNPEKFYPFICDLIQKNTVHITYQTSGLEGLIEGSCDIEKARILYKILMKREMPSQYLFILSGKKFISEEHIDNEIISFWKSFVALPLAGSSKLYNSSNEDRNDKLFNEGLRSVNGQALILIVNISVVELYRDKIFDYLLQISDNLPIQLKLVVLYGLNNKSEFTKEQYLDLFLAYTTEITSEIYHAASSLIGYLFYHSFKEMIPFVEQTISMPHAAERLGAFLLFGWFYGYEESKALLLQLHKAQPISIPETIKQACKYYSDTAYKDKCHFMLDMYVSVSDKKIRDAYSGGFYKFSPKDFLSIKSLIERHVQQINDERLHSLFDYLINCTKDYPIDCIEILQSIKYSKVIISQYELKEPIEILTLAYNSVKQQYDDSDESLDFVLDVFDELLQDISFRVEVDNILRELDA